MSLNNGDFPAMPCHNWHTSIQEPTGLTKREHFAGLAMQGLLASGEYYACDSTAKEAWDAADSLLYMQDRVEN